jgi:hypothetical protein
MRGRQGQAHRGPSTYKVFASNIADGGDVLAQDGLVAVVPLPRWL